MMDNNFNERVDKVFREVLHLQGQSFSDDTNRLELEVWDSLNHILLVDSFNKEFALRIPPEMALEMDTIGDTKRILWHLITHENA